MDRGSGGKEKVVPKEMVQCKEIDTTQLWGDEVMQSMGQQLVGGRGTK